MAMLEKYNGYCPKCGAEDKLKTMVCMANEVMATIGFTCECGNEWAVNYYGPAETIVEID